MFIKGVSKGWGRGAAPMVLALVLLLLAVLPAAAAQPLDQAFSDLPPGDPGYPFVKYLSGRDLMKGYPDGTFRGEGAITRAEMAAMLSRAGGLAGNKPPAPTFSDVGPGHWAYEVVEGAAAAGLLKGYPDGSFRGESPVSRAEAAVLLLKLTGAPLPGVKLDEAIKDVDPGHWALKQVAASLEAGLMTLADRGSFAPDQPATRLQVARGLAVMLNISPERSRVALTGTLKPVQGEVSVRDKDGRFRAVTAQTSIGAGATVKTGPGGRAEISFPDGSGLRLDPGSEMTIQEARGRPTIFRDGTPGVVVDWLKLDLPGGTIFGSLATTRAPGVSKANQDQTAAAGFFRGGLLASLNRLPGLIQLAQQEAGAADGENAPWWQTAYDQDRVRVEVDMPWGVAGIRGTFWMNLVAGGRNITSSVSGRVEFRSNGATVAVAPGQSSAITSPGSPPSPPAGMGPGERQAWQEVRQWVEQRAREIERLAPAISPPVPAALQGPPEPPGPLSATVPPPPPPQLARQILNSFNQSTGTTSSGGSGDSTPGGGTPGDTAPPAVTGSDPAADATGVPLNKTVTVTFSEQVLEGGAYGQIVVRDEAGESVAVEKSVSGQTLTLDPVQDLKNGAPVGGTLKVAFDLDLNPAMVNGIEIAGGGVTRTVSGSVSGRELTAAYSGLSYGTTYTVTIPAGSIQSLEYGTVNDELSWSFTTTRQP